MPHDITYMWNLKYDINENIYKTETDSQAIRNLWLLSRCVVGMHWECVIS